LDGIEEKDENVMQEKTINEIIQEKRNKLIIQSINKN
jgi:hypothetical protein